MSKKEQVDLNYSQSNMQHEVKHKSRTVTLEVDKVSKGQLTSMVYDLKTSATESCSDSCSSSMVSTLYSYSSNTTSPSTGSTASSSSICTCSSSTCSKSCKNLEGLQSANLTESTGSTASSSSICSKARKNPEILQNANLRESTASTASISSMCSKSSKNVEDLQNANLTELGLKELKKYAKKSNISTSSGLSSSSNNNSRSLSVQQRTSNSTRKTSIILTSDNDSKYVSKLVRTDVPQIELEDFNSQTTTAQLNVSKDLLKVDKVKFVDHVVEKACESGEATEKIYFKNPKIGNEGNDSMSKIIKEENNEKRYAYGETISPSKENNQYITNSESKDFTSQVSFPSTRLMPKLTNDSMSKIIQEENNEKRYAYGEKISPSKQNTPHITNSESKDFTSQVSFPSARLMPTHTHSKSMSDLGLYRNSDQIWNCERIMKNIFRHNNVNSTDSVKNTEMKIEGGFKQEYGKLSEKVVQKSADILPLTDAQNEDSLPKTDAQNEDSLPKTDAQNEDSLLKTKAQNEDSLPEILIDGKLKSVACNICVQTELSFPCKQSISKNTILTKLQDQQILNFAISHESLYKHPKFRLNLPLKGITYFKPAPTEVEYLTRNIFYEPSTAYRAFYNRMASSSEKHSPPAQFQPIPTNLDKRTRLTKLKPLLNCGPVKGSDYFRYSAPFLCPENCGFWFWMSDFAFRFHTIHPLIKLKTVEVGKVKTIDISLEHTLKNKEKCHTMLLVSGKVSNFGSFEYKDMLPLLIMSAQLARRGNENSTSGNDDYIMIWVCGLVPTRHPFPVVMAVCPADIEKNAYRYVVSHDLFSIRDSLELQNILTSNNRLLLTPGDFKELTGKEGYGKVKLQITVR